jgi:hypothetical protein
MSSPFNFLLVRRYALVASFLIGLIGCISPAAAGLGSCRADPIVMLSNGEQVRMTVAVDTDAAAVQQITYTLHAPVGTSITQIIYTGGPLQDKEQVLFYADRPENSYTTDTIVTSPISNVTVLTSTFLTNTFASVSGMTNQHLRLVFPITEPPFFIYVPLVVRSERL